MFPLLFLLIAAGFIYSRQVLNPGITQAKDRWLETKHGNDEIVYKSLHKRSVLINVIQMVLLLFIVVNYQLR